MIVLYGITVVCRRLWALPSLPPTEEEVHVFARVCLFVSLSVSKITEKRVHGFGEMLRVDRCRDIDELINF